MFLCGPFSLSRAEERSQCRRKSETIPHVCLCSCLPADTVKFTPLACSSESLQKHHHSQDRDREGFLTSQTSFLVLRTPSTPKSQPLVPVSLPVVLLLLGGHMAESCRTWPLSLSASAWLPPAVVCAVCIRVCAFHC